MTEEFRLFVKQDLDKIQSLKRKYLTGNFDENFEFKKDKELIFEPSFIDEVFNKIIHMEISKEQFYAIEDHMYLPTVQIDSEKGNFAAFHSNPDGKYFYFCDRLDLSGFIEQDFIPVFLILAWVDLDKPNTEEVLELKKYINIIKSDTSVKQEMRDLNIELKNMILKLNENRQMEKDLKSKETIEKLRNKLSVSNRIRLKMMNNVLGLDKVVFDNLIFDWAAEFGFRIDGDFILIGNADNDAFISSLDEQFEMWGKTEKSSI